MRALFLLPLLLAPALQDPGALNPPFVFAAYGDCRDGHDIHRKVCAAILKSEARFVVQSGDLVADGADPKLWETFRDVTKDLRAKRPYLTAKGNHDRSASGAFEKEFGLERPYFDRILGPIHFFFLDSNGQFEDADQLKWLETRAAASASPHKIAVFHHPPFTLVPHRTKAAESLRPRIHDLLVKLKFCAAICGHDHNFAAMERDGVRYVITGGGGAPLYDIDEKLPQKGDLWKVCHHFLLCRVGEKGIGATAVDPDGAEIKGLSFDLCRHP